MDFVIFRTLRGFMAIGEKALDIGCRKLSGNKNYARRIWEKLQEAYRTCRTIAFHRESEGLVLKPCGFIWNVVQRLQNHTNSYGI